MRIVALVLSLALVGFTFAVVCARAVERAWTNAYVRGASEMRDRALRLFREREAQANSGAWFAERFVSVAAPIRAPKGHWHLVGVHRHRSNPIHLNSGRWHGHFLWRHAHGSRR